MASCHSPFHPQVPHTNISILLAYCHQCQAWVRSTYTATFHDDEMMVLYEDSTTEYGPFDSVAVVLDSLIEHVAQEMFSSGRPWDAGHWNSTGPSDLAELDETP